MKAILIDDEQLALTYLKYQLNMIPGIEIVGAYTDPLEGKKAAEENEIDVVFLDIHIPELNGIELAERILESKPGVYVVFITTYEEYAIKAFELSAIDYILKPVRLERLKRTVQRIKQRKLAPVTSPHPSGLWSMRMFGRFRIVGEYQEHITFHFRTNKAQEIFFYLVHHHGKVIPKSILMDMFWPDFEWSRASSQLYTAVYHIRKTIEPFRDRIDLQNTNDGYVLKLQKMELDVDKFEQCLQAPFELSRENATEHERILLEASGEYLEGYPYDWAEYERQRYQLQWVRLMLNLVNGYYEQKQYEKAFKLCDRLCSRYPLEEQAQLMYLKLSDKMGNAFLVRRQYQTYKALLETDKMTPGDELTDWYRKWRKKREKE